MSQDVKVYRMNDTDSVAAHDLEQAKSFYREYREGEEDEFIFEGVEEVNLDEVYVGHMITDINDETLLALIRLPDMKVERKYGENYLLIPAKKSLELDMKNDNTVPYLFSSTEI
ncbi:hypothetical protein CEW46_21220 [Bacillus cereus]|nr:hypothetical protein CEW46_21220 [Bacillus cereus]